MTVLTDWRSLPALLPSSFVLLLLLSISTLNLLFPSSFPHHQFRFSTSPSLLACNRMANTRIFCFLIVAFLEAPHNMPCRATQVLLKKTHVHYPLRSVAFTPTGGLPAAAIYVRSHNLSPPKRFQIVAPSSHGMSVILNLSAGQNTASPKGGSRP